MKRFFVWRWLTPRRWQKLTEGGDVAGMRAALSYVGMVAAQYSQVSGKEFDVRYHFPR